MPISVSARTAVYIVIVVVALWVIISFLLTFVGGVNAKGCEGGNLWECFSLPLKLAAKIFNFGLGG